MNADELRKAIIDAVGFAKARQSTVATPREVWFAFHLRTLLLSQADEPELTAALEQMLFLNTGSI